MLLKILISCLTLALASCHARWNNDHSTVAVDCQVSREEAQKRFLQVLNEKGEPLSADQKASLVAEFLPHQGERQRPRVTPGGCVEIPDGSGELAVVASKSKAAVYWKTAETQERFLTRALIKKPVFTFESVCQGENRFANTQLKRDWSITTDGSLQNIRLKVQARNVFDQTIVPLYQKDFGEDLALPETWSTAALREGQYHLEVLQQELTDGLETAPRMVSFAAVCPLTVLHHAPTLLGLMGDEATPAIVDWEKGLDWKPAQDYVTTHACWEERSTLPQNSSVGDSCQAIAHCQDPAQYKSTKKIRPEREGVFNVFAFAQDPAGNKSQTSCRTVVFSSQAPVFDVSWVKKRWNNEGFVLDEATPILKAQVSGLSHKDVPPEQIAQSLECKAEVILRSVETVTTPSVICTEGRCKGLSMDRFQPCDANIGIGIYKYWRSQYSRHATLRLKVRASDLSQHVREKTLNIVLDGEQWQRQTIDLPSDIGLAPYSLFEDPEGRLLGLGGDYVGLWKDNKFINVSPGNGWIEPIRTRDNAVYFFKGDSPRELQVMRWSLGQWESIGKSFDFGEDHPRILRHPQRGFWLYTPQKAYLVQDDKVKPAPILPENFGPGTQTSIDHTGCIWAFEGDTVHALNPGQGWTKLDVPRQNNREGSFEYTYWVDGNAHLWMLVADRSSSPPLLAEVLRIDGEEQQSYPELVHQLAHATRMVESFVLDASYTPLIGKYKWSEEKLAWERNPLFEGIEDHVDVGAFWNNREMAWTTLEGRLYLEEKGQLRLFPLSMSLGESPFITTSKDVFVTGFDGFFRLQWRPWTERNEELDDMDNVLGLWTGSHGRIRTCSSTLSIWEQNEGIWSSLMNVSGLDTGMTFGCFEDRQANLFIHTSTSIWWQAAGAKNPVKLAASMRGKGPIGFIQDSAGLIWFACQDRAGQASLCSYDNTTLQHHSLPGQAYSDSHSRPCSLEVGNDLFFVGDDISVVYRRMSQNIEALSGTIPFPDGKALDIDTCYRIDASIFLISSDDLYYLWNNQNQRLHLLENFDSGLRRSYFMPEQISFQTSSDGYLYLMALEAEVQEAEPVLLSDKIRQGFVFRLAPDGTLSEIMKPEARIRAFDQRNEMPQMLFSDRNGMLWGLSLSSVYWKQRLIQFYSPIL